MNKTWRKALFAVQYMGGGDISKGMAKKFGTCEKVRVESSNILEQEITNSWKAVRISRIEKRPWTSLIYGLKKIHLLVNIFVPNEEPLL